MTMAASKPTPFLDQHGEFDIGLRRGRPLFLNSSRYNGIRRMFLDHQLACTIARDIDPEFNIGGWIHYLASQKSRIL